MKYIILLLLLTSCSANYFCRKCQSLGGIKTDSTQQVIEIKTPGVEADTTIQNPLFGGLGPFTHSLNFDSLRNANPDEFAMLHDTVRIDKERLHIKLVPGKTIYVQGKCDPITRDSVVTKTVTNTITTGISETRYYITAIACILLALVAGAGIMWLFGRR